MTALLFWLAIAGPVWAAIAAWVIPQRYRLKGRDPRLARLSAAMGAAAFGPLWVGYLLKFTPELRARHHVLTPAVVVLAEVPLLFRSLFPTNPCVTNAGYVVDQVQAGLTIGAVYATMAVGLTLIFSVLNLVNLGHGQFVLLGGVVSYLLLTNILKVNAVIAIPLIGVGGFIFGMLVDAALLSPMHRGRVERPDEYAVLITYGLGLLIQYVIIGILGPTPGLEAPRFTDRPFLGLENLATNYTFGPAHISTNLVIAATCGIVLLILLGWFLNRTWAGRRLRAVAMNPQAAAIAGIDTNGTYLMAFGLGSALATMAGAALVPVLAFTIPDFASQIAVTSWVIIVLGGLGSLRGALLGSLIIGVVQALGAACYPDPSKGATYQVAFGLIVFAAVLLIRPEGLYGRKT